MSMCDNNSEAAYEYDVDDPEVRLAEKLEHLRASLSLEMIRLREEESLTQKQMGERLGIGQPQISKLENPDIESSMESIVRYLDALGADLAVGIRTPSEFIQVSDDRDYELHVRSGKSSTSDDRTPYRPPEFRKSRNGTDTATNEAESKAPSQDVPMAS